MVDKINVLQATFRAMTEAVHSLQAQFEPGTAFDIRVDGNKVPPVLQKEIESSPSGSSTVQAIIKGDQKDPAISAASVIAKVTRDEYMVQQAKLYPQYGFEQHKGYVVAAHRKAIEKYGPCPIHRKSFEPVKSFLAKKKV
jgi:ribonuclease HII